MIPGSQFDLSVSGRSVDIFLTSAGDHLPLPVGGQVTIEVFTGTGAVPTIAPGYHGLAVLGDHRIELISGSFAVEDTGGDNDTIIAHGDYETVIGGTGDSLLVARGDFDLIQAHGDDTVNLSGAYDTVQSGAGSVQIDIYGDHDQAISSSGNDTINVHSAHNEIFGGSGNDTINIYGDGNIVHAGSHDLIQLLGSGTTIVDTAQAYHDTVVGFTEGTDHVHLTTDTPEHAVSSQQVNGGRDTLITLTDGSTILFKGVSHLDSGFFS
jgi:hypothetical protein